MSEPGHQKKSFFNKLLRSKDKTGRKKDEQEEGEPSQPPVQEPIVYHPYGLKCVSEGKDPTVDIVAVHGLNGHRENTWKADNGVSWLADEDMLPEKIPNARIFVWGYDARTHGNDYMSEAYLHQHGSQLVSELADERRLDGTSKRPIIFIGHSLGGIVIKSALIHSNATHAGHLSHHRPVKVSTYGILFMGTPHSGGEGVTMGQIAQSVASIFVHTNDRVLQHLQKQSEWLSKQKDDYASIMRDFVTKFGWEVYATPLFGGLSKLIVPQWSAIGWQDNAEPVQIMANHITMVKFRGKDDPEYNKVWKKLAIMAQEAGEKIERNWQVEEGQIAVANALLNIPFSKEMAVEVLARLLRPPADLGDSGPEDEYHLTSGGPDVLYDENNGVYEPKVERISGEAACVEETERMRKHQTKLLKAVELYETDVGSKNIMLSTGVSLASQHDWDDVLSEAETVRKRYRPREGSNSIPTLQNSLRTFELAQPRVDQWLALLPGTAPCASRLCGGLKVVFAIIWRSGMLSSEIYNALKQIPITISHAQDLTLRYEPEALAEHVGQLFCAVIDTLRHIITEYTKISASGRQVHFSQDFRLMDHYKNLIQLEQQVVVNQRVRVETLNSLKSMGDKRWDLIFSVLNEQLTETQDDQELEDLDEGMKRTRETSINADLYEALDYDHLLCHQDLKETMRCRFHFSASEHSRVTWLVENEPLRDWVTSPISELLFINGNENSHDTISSVSVYCGMITRALQSQVPRVVLYWYCGLNVNEDITGMLRNLIGQLLDHMEADGSPLKSDKKVWYAGLRIDDMDILFRLFKKILKSLLKTATVFCILDGISFYEDNDRIQNLSELVVAFATLIDSARQSNFIFKVLLTSPNRSDVADDVGGNTDIGPFEVLEMPGFVMTDRSELAEFEFLRNISRRNSISSVGSTPTVYYETTEYLDDSEQAIE